MTSSCPVEGLTWRICPLGSSLSQVSPSDDGEIRIVEEDGKLVWECPNCHNRDQDKMNVARRTCGYIGTQFWNQGRTQEIKERVLHVS